MNDIRPARLLPNLSAEYLNYLMYAPEPEWMAVGVPAVDKGKELGLELLESVESELEMETEN